MWNALLRPVEFEERPSERAVRGRKLRIGFDGLLEIRKSGFGAAQTGQRVSELVKELGIAGKARFHCGKERARFVIFPRLPEGAGGGALQLGGAGWPGGIQRAVAATLGVPELGKRPFVRLPLARCLERRDGIAMPPEFQPIHPRQKMYGARLRVRLEIAVELLE